MSDTKKTQVVISSFKGHPTMAIWQVDPAGNKLGKAPIVAFGLNKAKEILEHKDSIVEFLKQNGYAIKK